MRSSSGMFYYYDVMRSNAQLLARMFYSYDVASDKIAKDKMRLDKEKECP